MTILKSAFVWWCCRLPFDWKTPITYLMALAIMYVVLIHVYIFASAAISFEIGSYLWVVEFIEDIKHDTESINKIAKSRRNRWQTMQRLRDSIEFHCHIKQFSICFLNFRWNIRISTVWSLDLILQNLGSSVMFQTLVNRCWLQYFRGVWSQFAAHCWSYKCN